MSCTRMTVLLSLSRFGCSFHMSNCPNRSFRSCHALVTLLYVWQQVGVWHSNRAKTSCTELFEVHFVQQDLSFTCFEFINFCFVLWYLFNVIDSLLKWCFYVSCVSVLLSGFWRHLSSMAPQPIVISGPSGSGKSTLLTRLFQEFPNCFAFSVSRKIDDPIKFTRFTTLSLF